MDPDGFRAGVKLHQLRAAWSDSTASTSSFNSLAHRKSDPDLVFQEVVSGTSAHDDRRLETLLTQNSVLKETVS